MSYSRGKNLQLRRWQTWVAKTLVNNPVSKESLQNIHYCVCRNTSGEILKKKQCLSRIYAKDQLCHYGITFKDEAQTALFKDPVRTAL